VISKRERLLPKKAKPLSSHLKPKIPSSHLQLWIPASFYTPVVSKRKKKKKSRFFNTKP